MIGGRGRAGLGPAAIVLCVVHVPHVGWGDEVA